MYWTGKDGPTLHPPHPLDRGAAGRRSDPVRNRRRAVRQHHAGHRLLGHRRSWSPSTTSTNSCDQRRDPLRRRAPRKDRNRDRRTARRQSLRVKPDPDLLETLTYITEFPTAIRGDFDPQYLELPSEVLITVMRHHQKYFSVEDAERQPRAALRRRDEHQRRSRRPGQARQRARAESPLQRRPLLLGCDQKKKLADRVEDLANVTFQAKLGSYFEKTHRVVDAGEGARRQRRRPARGAAVQDATSPPTW